MVLTLPVGLLSALTVALLRSRTTSVAVVPLVPGRALVVVGELLPGLAGVHAPPEAAVEAAQGRVDDHAAAGSRLGIDHDLVGAGDAGDGTQGGIGLGEQVVLLGVRASCCSCCRAASRSAPPSIERRKPTPCMVLPPMP